MRWPNRNFNLLGNDRSLHETFVQVAGDAVRITASRLREAIAASRTLELALLKIVHLFLDQTGNTALANGTATVDERLARWLVLANDGLEGDEFPLPMSFVTHARSEARRCHCLFELSRETGTDQPRLKKDHL